SPRLYQPRAGLVAGVSRPHESPRARRAWLAKVDAGAPVLRQEATRGAPAGTSHHLRRLHLRSRSLGAGVRGGATSRDALIDALLRRGPVPRLGGGGGPDFGSSFRIHRLGVDSGGRAARPI